MNPLKRSCHPILALLALATTAVTVHAYDPAQMGPPPENSAQYLVQIAGCADCHTDKDNLYMAGGVEFILPHLGRVYTPNLTPDPVNGIGKWSFADFKRALRDGVSPSGHSYYPVFPYRSYTKLTDADIQKIWDYFRTLPPIPKPSRAADIWMPRVGVLGWDLLYFWNSFPKSAWAWIKRGHGEFRPIPSRGPEWNRGAYIAESLAHCTECHTARNPLTNGLKGNAWMAGGEVEGAIAPNITSDEKTGRGKWSETDWDVFLRVGRNKNGEFVQNEKMREVVQNTAGLTDADRHALIVYLRALPAVQKGEDAP